jgi:hypothetical protein
MFNRGRVFWVHEGSSCDCESYFYHFRMYAADGKSVLQTAEMRTFAIPIQNARTEFNIDITIDKYNVGLKLRGLIQYVMHQ